MKIFLRILAGLGILVALLIVYITLNGNKKFDAPYPNITASKDSAIIARGRYLAFGPMHCASCHTPMANMAEIDAGKEMPMLGGWEISIPPGTFRARNLTPDMETGIGKLSDKEIARTLRYGVGSDGRLIFPFMPFKDVSDDDLTALISFLRSQEPTKNEIAPSEYTFLGKFLMTIEALKPDGPAVTPPISVLRDSTAEYGKYLAYNVTNCRGCHTPRNIKTGEFTGPDFSGGFVIPPGKHSNDYAFVTPNLTTDVETGVMAEWSEQAFINRMRGGRVHKSSPMPWGSISRMDDSDLKAIYRYLHSLEPIKNKIDKIVFEPGEELPS